MAKSRIRFGLFILMVICGVFACGHKNQKPYHYFSNQLDMQFIFIPKGTFQMGSPVDEPHRDEDEVLHSVTFTKPFLMQTTEVTQKQWMAVMGENPSRFAGLGEDLPVENVSWKDANEFIRRLNKMEGMRKYRLPTEAEWEYACRAGSKDPFAFGDCLLTEKANYDGDHPLPGCPKGKNIRKTVVVAGYPPNAWGLYDMHGNVYEWVQDHCSVSKKSHDVVTDTYVDIVDPICRTGDYRILRGGSWYYNARYCRSAYRSYNTPNYRHFNVGFRLAANP